MTVKDTARARWVRALGVVLVLLALAAIPVLAETPSALQQADEQTPPANPGSNTFRVFAHPEGLVGHTTANGHVIQPDDFFVALPCFCVLSSNGGNEFQVRIEYKGKSLTLPVWDVGPWNVDDNYWDPQSERTWSDLPRGLPQAEAAYYDNFNGGLDGWDREILSPAGMDIADGAFAALGMTGSDWVDVTFLWLDRSQEVVKPDLPEPPTRFADIQTVWFDEQPPLGPAEQVEDPRYGYIVETQHNVPVEFMDYWYTHGGWKTLGLPISEFHRFVYEDGSIAYLQYFERTILKMTWPEGGDGPAVQAVEIGQQTYIDPAAAEQVEPFPADDWATYFPDTGHSLGGGFRIFWEANGGEAVFGQPLSEEWSTTSRDGRKVVMQVFEHARMEWWPDGSPTGDPITLGLLTVEMLQRIGWLETGE